MNTLRTLTIIFNLLIIIGAGHGGAPLGFFEVMSLRSLFSGDFQFNVSGSYDDKLMTVGIVSLLGQCVLIASRSEEHTSELQSQSNIVCRLLIEKKRKKKKDQKKKNNT